MRNSKEYARAYRAKHKNNIAASKRKWREKNPEYSKKYYVEHKQHMLEKIKKYHSEHSDEIKEYQSRWRKENKIKKSEYGKEYRVKNKQKLREKQKIYRREVESKSTEWILKQALRKRLTAALKAKQPQRKKYLPTLELLGCSIEEFKAHLEKQFKPGMNWDNYGKWHIDHIIPCKLFDLNNMEEQRKCFNYTNLQPLWESENLRKNGKYEGEKNVHNITYTRGRNATGYEQRI